MDDKEWYEQTKAKVEAWLKEKGFRFMDTDYRPWALPKAGWRLQIQQGNAGSSWFYKPSHTVMHIVVDAYPAKGFTKKIFRESDKTDAVLSRLGEAMEKAIALKAEKDAQDAARDAERNFQKKYIAENLGHFPNVTYRAYGNDEESFLVDVKLNALTMERAKAVIKAIGG